MSTERKHKAKKMRATRPRTCRAPRATSTKAAAPATTTPPPPSSVTPDGDLALTSKLAHG